MIYLVRHGLDDESYIGGYSDVDLIDFGKNQIHEVGIWLKRQELDVNRIYTSDIKRAITTGGIINSYLGLPIFETEDLRELDKGMLTGMKKDVAMIEYPDYVNVNDVSIRYPNGESMLDLYMRIRNLLNNINIYDKSLLVTHRGVINMLYCLIRNDVLDMNKERYNVSYGSVHELNLNKMKIRRIR